MKIYVETAEGTDNFYLDEAACAVEGTVIDGAGQPEFTVKGDVNMDKVFDLADAVLLQKWLLGDTNTETADWEAGDLNKDGRLNAVDLTLMKRMLPAS